jgi:CHAD domain-containing protein
MGASSQGDGGFGDGLAGAARAIITDARGSLTDPKFSDAEAVHEVRKALKRWRALMRLLSGPLDEQAEEMRLGARDLMRALTGARDAQSTLDALGDLRDAEVAISEATMATIRSRITAIREAAEQTGFTQDMRGRLNSYLDLASLSLDRWQLEAITFDAVADALTATYRKARQLLPDKWQETEAEHLHDLRRRVVEHRHQMDLVEHLWPRLGRVWAEEAQRLRNRLGACQDLAVLTALTAPRQPLARWRSRLLPAIEARRMAHLKTASRIASRLFAEKPKAFRRRMTALYAARHSRTSKPKGE